MKKKIVVSLIIIIVATQFVRTEVATAVFEPEQDLLNITQANEEVVSLMKTTCYDCHSEETKTPWYAQVAPFSWWINDHINEGKEHLNFSAFGMYSAKKAAHKMEECYEELEKGEMPLTSYTITHADARLSDEQKATLINWFKSVEKKYKDEIE
jgi:hypothetical protein